MTPMSRAVYETWFKNWKRGIRPEDPIDKAATWYFLKVCSVNGNSGWIHADQNNKAQLWQSHVRILEKAVKRLQNVQFECRDFAQVITTYDNTTTVFYVDPPYINVPRVDSYYRGAPPMTVGRHYELASILNSVKGKVILSYYPDPVLESLYPQGNGKGKWLRLKYQRIKSSQGTDEECVKPEATELLLLNYEPLPLLGLLAKNQDSW